MSVQIPDIQKTVDKLSSLASVSENNILLSLLEYHNKKGYVSEAQAELFKRISDRYSDESLAAEKAWRDAFTNEMKNDFGVCCEYYESSGYFTGTVNKYRQDKNYIPNKNEYEKLCTNKYATKLLENRKKTCGFVVGSLVQTNSKYKSYNQLRLTGNVGWFHRNEIYNKPLMVIRNDIVVNSDLHRWVEVMVFASPETIFQIREDALKTYKPAKS